MDGARNRIVENERLLGLVKAAAEVNELEAAIDGKAQDVLRPARARPRRLWPVGILAAAALVALFVVPRGLRIVDCEVVRVAERGSDTAPDAYRISLSLSRPGFIRIVVVDERLERWILPFEDRAAGATQPVDERWTGTLPLQVARLDPRGPALVKYYMVIASSDQSPRIEELLPAIPDPVAESSADAGAVLRRLQELGESLSSRFDCVVHLDRVP